MSIIYNQKYNITSEAGKKANRFDPWFLYNQVGYLEDDPCENGVSENEILELSYRIGNKKTTLNSITTLTHNFTNPKWSSMVELELIKNDVKVSFAKGEYDEADKLIEVLNKNFKNIPYDEKSSVHAGTLKAFAKERYSLGETLPEEYFSVYEASIAKVKLGKEK